MASVNFEKLKTPQQVKAMLRHCDIKMRKQTNHSNDHINKGATDNNRQYDDRDYKTTCDIYDNRMKMLDSMEKQNKRKDRVTCFGLVIPFPEDLPTSREEEWFKRVNSIVRKFAGKENVLNFYVHADEVHNYKDAETGKDRTSRKHIHVYCIPEINGKLNGKKFSSRSRIEGINNDIHKMTQEQFGVDFMDGSKKKSKKSVETLKNASREREAQERMQHIADREEAQHEFEEGQRIRRKKMKEREKEIDQKEKELDEREFTLDMKEEMLNRQQEELNGLRFTLNRWKEDLLEDKEKVKECLKLCEGLPKMTDDVRKRYEELKRLHESLGKGTTDIPEQPVKNNFTIT